MLKLTGWQPVFVEFLPLICQYGGAGKCCHDRCRSIHKTRHHTAPVSIAQMKTLSPESKPVRQLFLPLPYPPLTTVSVNRIYEATTNNNIVVAARRFLVTRMEPGEIC